MESDPTPSYKVDGCTASKTNCRCVRMLITPSTSYLVIIDGLDECHDKTRQQSILQLLCELIRVYKLPLRFLVGSCPESHIRNSLIGNLSIQSLTESSSMKHFILEEISEFFSEMALRKSVPTIPSCLTWNNHGLGMSLLISLCNDHPVSSSTQRLSSNLLVPIFAAQGNSLRLY